MSTTAKFSSARMRYADMLFAQCMTFAHCIDNHISLDTLQESCRQRVTAYLAGVHDCTPGTHSPALTQSKIPNLNQSSHRDSSLAHTGTGNRQFCNTRTAPNTYVRPFVRNIPFFTSRSSLTARLGRSLPMSKERQVRHLLASAFSA